MASNGFIYRKRGFTLIELLVVISVIGILIAHDAACCPISSGSCCGDAVCE